MFLIAEHFPVSVVFQHERVLIPQIQYFETKLRKCFFLFFFK